MRRYILTLLIFPLLTAAHDMVPGQLPEKAVALVNGRIFTVHGDPIEDGILVMEDGQILYVGRDRERIPQDAERLDLKGGYVYPGLIALNTQVGLTEIDAVRATNDRSETGRVTPEVRADQAYNPDSEIIPTLRSHGILTVESVPGGSLIAGRSSVLNLDGWSIAEASVRENAALHIDLDFSRWDRSLRSDAERKKRVREKAAEIHAVMESARDYQQLKRAGDAEQLMDLRLESILPVLSGDMPVFFHAGSTEAMRQAMALARSFDLKAALVGAASAEDILPEIRASGLTLILNPPLTLPEHEDEDYDRPYRLAGAVKEAGIPFCLSHGGSWRVRDLPNAAGFTLAYGLSGADALRSITLDAARTLGIEGRLGSLEAGKDATLFVSEGDVLVLEQSRVTMAFIQGRPVDLNDRHKTLYEKYKQKYSDR